MWPVYKVTIICAAAIILGNLIPVLAALFDRDGTPIVYAPCMDFLVAPISLLLTPLVWSSSDELCEQESSRYILLCVHLQVSLGLPFLCYLIIGVGI
jgi:hypothetical protein